MLSAAVGAGSSGTFSRVNCCSGLRIHMPQDSFVSLCVRVCRAQIVHKPVRVCTKVRKMGLYKTSGLIYNPVCHIRKPHFAGTTFQSIAFPRGDERKCFVSSSDGCFAAFSIRFAAAADIADDKRSARRAPLLGVVPDACARV